MRERMTARETVLAAVRASRPPAVPHPDVSAAIGRFKRLSDPVQSFIDATESAGANVVQGDRRDLEALIAAAHDAAGRRVSALESLDERELAEPSPHSFADSEVFVCEGVLGVAENGAVWLPLSRLRHRSAVFLATHVIVVLNRARIVDNLHAAYRAIDVASEGFGVFVAGPSKTADIEQALVIGAHGAKGLTVLLVEG
jgi:L-lactate dehydrogenase complex protein LldG